MRVSFAPIHCTHRVHIFLLDAEKAFLGAPKSTPLDQDGFFSVSEESLRCFLFWTSWERLATWMEIDGSRWQCAIPPSATISLLFFPLFMVIKLFNMHRDRSEWLTFGSIAFATLPSTSFWSKMMENLAAIAGVGPSGSWWVFHESLPCWLSPCCFFSMESRTHGLCHISISFPRHVIARLVFLA